MILEGSFFTVRLSFVFLVENVSLLLDFADEYQIGGLRSRCLECLDKEVQKATVCKITDEGRCHILRVLTIVSKHSQEALTEKLIPQAARIPTEYLKLYYGVIKASVMQKVYEKKLYFWTGTYFTSIVHCTKLFLQGPVLGAWCPQCSMCCCV